MSNGNWIGRCLSQSGSRRFGKKAARSSSAINCSVTSWPFQMKALRSFERSRTTQPTTQPHIPEGKNVKCTLVQALRLCTGRTAHRGSRGIGLPFLDHGTRSGWGVSVTPRPLFTPRKDPVPIVQEAGWALGPVWTGTENLASTGIRSPDRPARSQSLYRLSYPAQCKLL